MSSVPDKTTMVHGPGPDKHAIAIDAGFGALGVAVLSLKSDRVVALHCHRTKKLPQLSVAQSNAKRCGALAQTLQNNLTYYQPTIAVVELPHGGAASASAMRDMSLATGVVASVLALSPEIVTLWTTPGEGKTAVVKPNATKREVIEAVADLYPDLLLLSDWIDRPAKDREHMADALAAYHAVRNLPIVMLAKS